MKEKSRRSVLVHVLALTMVVELALSFSALGQQSKQPSQADRYPLSIKVYTKDGKESLTGNCVAKDPATGQVVYSPRDASAVNEITCSIVRVQYITPGEGSKETPMPSTYEEFVKQAVKADPKVAEEMKTNPKKAREEWNKVTEELCSKKSLAGLQKQMKNLQMGPKKNGFYQTWLKACSSKDFKTVIDNMNTLSSRTCSMWVESFTIDFKRIGKKWLNNPGPQGLCNVVSTYELDDVSYGLAGTVKYTVVTVGGTRLGKEGEFVENACKAIREDQKEPTIYSLTYNDEFEPPCDFIKYDYILAPPPQ